MAITTLDGALAGMRPDEFIYKVGTAPEAIGIPHSHWYATGRPGAGSAPSPGINGAAVTGNAVAGQIPRTNPGSGNAHLGRLALTGSLASTLLLCDRLWHNSGLSITSTSAQAITPATLPARDRDGSTNGVGVMAALEWSAAGGAGTPTVTLTYTDESGNTGVTTTFTGVTTPNLGTFFIWPLAAGDTGVRAVTSYQQSATWTSGTAHIILFRVLAVIGNPVANVANAVDALTSGLPRIYDNSVPFLVYIPSSTTAANITGHYVETQG
jgi:hypothetical protein